MTNLNASQFQKQDVMRTLTVGFQPYMPFSQQYAMSLRQQGEPGYFELTPKPIYGDSMLPTTGKGKNYSFRTRMETYMGEGEGNLAYMSRNTTGSGDRATQVANAPPQDTGHETIKAAQKLHSIFRTMGPHQAFKFQDPGERALGAFTANMDKVMNKGKSTQQAAVDRGVKRGGVFWGNDFDIKLEQTSNEFRGFLSSIVGKEEMENVESMEMTRAEGSSATRKMLSMSQKELGTTEPKQARMNFKKHVDSKLNIMNKAIKDAVKDMWKLAKTDPQILEQYEKDRLSKFGASPALAARSLIKTNADSLLNTTIRDFLGKTTRSTMIAQIKGSTGPARHLYQVKLGRRMLGFALISAKNIPYKTISYPRLEVAPKVFVVETTEGANNLINAYGDYLKTHEGQNAKLVDATIAKADSYANDIAVLTEDRVGHMWHSSSVGAAEMVMDSTGLTVGDTVQSNITLTPMAIAENIRQQMIKHFTKGGASRKFKQWYDSLLAKSNLLTKSWYSGMPLEGKHGGSFSKEWTYGDNKGNPNKRYLGVWSKANQDTWKNDVGKNVSIAPFIISRRKGVAAFRKGGDYGSS